MKYPQFSDKSIVFNAYVGHFIQRSSGIGAANGLIFSTQLHMMFERHTGQLES